jgi:hypothetical protein
VLLLVMTMILAAGFAWLTWGPGETPTVPEPAWSPAETAPLVAAVMALGLLAYLVVRSAGRRRTRVQKSQAPVRMLQLDAAPAEPVEADSKADPVEDHVEAELLEEPVVEPAPPLAQPALQLEGPLPPVEDERVTLLHIRTLETALEEQSAQLTAAQTQLEHRSLAGRDVERVLLTIGALRERVNGSPDSERILNRVEAAINRLAPASGPGRPALPSPVMSARSLAPAAAAQGAATEPDAVPAGATPPPAPEPSHPAPAGATPPDDVFLLTPQEIAPAGDGRVLPVPAPPVQPAPRGKRWRRRGAA